MSTDRISIQELEAVLAALRVVEASETVTDYFRDDYEEILRPLNDAIATFRLAYDTEETQ